MSDQQSNSIRVLCRFRPPNQKESAFTGVILHKTSDSKNVALSANDSQQPLYFAYDHVFLPQTTQKEVYEISAKPVLEAVMQGFNGTIFAYGQTSSGKTHTMFGEIDDLDSQGIIPRISSQLFEYISNADPSLEFSVKIGFAELYLEHIKDLLNPVEDNLQIKEDRNKGVYIAGLSEYYVTENSEILNLMKIGNQSREVGATNMNQQSSRSHTIFIITVHQQNNQDFSAKTGKLYLVDLAGSEKVSKTHAQGQRLNEAKNINQSLSVLGKVINSLTDGKSTHVPYRDSKLTRILQDSLGGNSKTTLIITCSPSVFNEAETMSTLRFGVRAKAIKNKPKINREYTVAELKLLLDKAHKQIAIQQETIGKMRKAMSRIGEVDFQAIGIEEKEIGDEQVEDLRYQLEEMQEANQVLRDRLEQQFIELQHSQKQNQNLSQEIENKGKKVKYYKQQLDLLQQELCQTNNLNSSYRSSIQNVEETYHDLNNMIQQLHSENKAICKGKGFELLNQQIYNQQESMKLMHQQLDEKQKLLDKIEENEMVDEESRKQILLEIQQNRIIDNYRVEQQRLLIDIQKRIDMILDQQAELDKIKDDYEELKYIASANKSKIAKEVLQLRAHITMLQQKYHQVYIEKSILNQSYKHLSNKSSISASILAKKSVKIKQLKVKLEHAAETISKLQSSMDAQAQLESGVKTRTRRRVVTGGNSQIPMPKNGLRPRSLALGLTPRNFKSEYQQQPYAMFYKIPYQIQQQIVNKQFIFQNGDSDRIV